MKRIRFYKLLICLTAVGVSSLAHAGEYFSLQLDDDGLQHSGSNNVVQASAESRAQRSYCAPQKAPSPVPCATTSYPPQRRYSFAPCPSQQKRYQPCRNCPPPCTTQVQAVPQAVTQGIARQQGYFAASAPRGEVSGESNSIGIRGFAIEFPAIRLALPTIQLPSCFRTRRGPEVRTEAGYAAYTNGSPAVYGQLLPGGQAVVQNQIQTQARIQAQSQIQRQQQLEAELELTPELLSQLQKAIGEKKCKTPPPQPCPPKYPCATTSSTNEEIAALNREYEARLRQIMEAKRSQIRQLERQLEEMRMRKCLDDDTPIPAPAPIPAIEDDSTKETNDEQSPPTGTSFFRVSPFGDGN